MIQVQSTIFQKSCTKKIYGPQNISSLLDITRPLHFLNSFRTTASAELLNFQDPIQKSDFDTYQIKRQCVSLPEKVVGQP